MLGSALLCILCSAWYSFRKHYYCCRSTRSSNGSSSGSSNNTNNIIHRQMMCRHAFKAFISKSTKVPHMRNELVNELVSHTRMHACMHSCRYNATNHIINENNTIIHIHTGYTRSWVHQFHCLVIGARTYIESLRAQIVIPAFDFIILYRQHSGVPHETAIHIKFSS